ncbi:MAG: FHA domain-containing serine/threonine-protein kinase [Planctomycetota bacterium]
MTHITVVNGPASGTQVALQRGEVCTIGSGPECTIRIALPGIAAVQAEIKALRTEGFGIKRSGGPVAVNGASVEAARLRDGDMIDVGSVQLLYGPPSDEGADDLLGGHRLLEVLGKGGMGTVYRAEQVSLHRPVALKVLDQKLTQDPVFVARFVAEARAAARLHHPNVVQVYDVGHEGSTYFYSMELMTEGSVETKLKAEGTLDVETATKAIADAARGLAYAESLRIVHRDIKPDNLMLDHHGSVKLADLGLALTDENDEGKLVGTPHFMSPEQILRKPLDHRSDLYALGCTFYRVLAGRNPFTGSSVKDILRAHVKETAEPLHKVRSDVPVELSNIVQQLMAKDPAERIQSATDLVEALESVLKPPMRKGLIVGSIVAALLVAGAAVTYALTREKEVIKIDTTDPSAVAAAAANAARAREAEAEAAYFRVKAQKLSGTALAEALEAMAKEHEGCASAITAHEEAVKVRQEVADAAAAAAARADAIAREKDALSTRVRQALAKGDYRAVEDALALGQVPETLRATPALDAARKELAAEVAAATTARLGELTAAVARAREQKDADAIEQSCTTLAAVLDGDGAWPESLRPDTTQALALLTDARGEAAELRAAETERQVEVGWKRLDSGFTDGDGILDKVAHRRWREALQAAKALASELQGQPAGAQALGLMQSLECAVAHLDKVVQAAQEQKLTLAVPNEGEPCTVTAFVPEGDDAGFTVKVGPKHQPRPLSVKWSSLDVDALANGLTLPDADAADGVASVLGWLELAHQLEAARAYLVSLDPASDTSGTGNGSYPLNDQVASRLAEQLAGSREPWAKALHAELAAAAGLAAGLQAFSGQRNLAAAEHVERLLQEHQRRLLVSALR